MEYVINLFVDFTAACVQYNYARSNRLTTEISYFKLSTTKNNDSRTLRLEIEIASKFVYLRIVVYAVHWQRSWWLTDPRWKPTDLVR